jgi:hypothetical protein
LGFERASILIVPKTREEGITEILGVLTKVETAILLLFTIILQICPDATVQRFHSLKPLFSEGRAIKITSVPKA